MKSRYSNHPGYPVVPSPLKINGLLELGQSDQLSFGASAHGISIMPNGNNCNYSSMMETSRARAEPFGPWLGHQVARREWTPADFARRVGVGNGTVSRWLTGVRRPSTEAVDRIADVLGIDIDLVLAKAGHRPPVFEVDPDSPEGELIPLIRKVSWNEERLESVKNDLRFYIELDRRRGKKET